MADLKEGNFKILCIDSYYTQRDKVNFSYKWSIEDFLNLQHTHTQCLTSERFPKAEGQVAYFQLCLYPRGSDQNEDYVALLLNLVSAGSTLSRADYIFTADDEDGNTIGSLNSSKSHWLKNNGCWFYTERKALEKALKNTKTGTLIISCSLTVFLNVAHKPGPSMKSDWKLFTDTYSSNNLEFLLSDENYSDFVIKIDNRKFKVHRNILHARSLVFAAMFGSNMEEAKSSEVTLDDVDPDVFEKVLRFIYTGSLAIMDSDALNLLPVADKYQIDSLKQQCVDVSIAQICSMNAVKALLLADAHNLEDLKKVAIEFISKNTEVVSKTDEWTMLVSKYPRLTTNLLLATNSTPATA